MQAQEESVGQDEPPVQEESAGHEPSDDSALAGVRFAIHVASFRQIARAGKEKEYLEKKGFTAKVVAIDIKGEEWFRIFVGDYATREEAARARTELMDAANVGYARIIKLEEME